MLDLLIPKISNFELISQKIFEKNSKMICIKQFFCFDEIKDEIRTAKAIRKFYFKNKLEGDKLKIDSVIGNIIK